jgi:hypothetical protein
MVHSAKVGLSAGNTYGSKLELTAVGPVTSGFKFSGPANPLLKACDENLVVKLEEQFPD